MTDPVTGERIAASDEQAALHRVAALVAAGAGPGELFGAVAQEVARVLSARTIMMARLEPEGVMTVLASVDDPPFRPGSRWPLDGPSVALAVRDTGQPARISDYTGLEGTIAAGVRDSGVAATAGVPITVDGAVWGVVRVGTRGDDPLPDDTEERLGNFTELVGIAITHAESRDRVRRLTEQQAALRRVATLVAGGVSIDVICRTVVDEIAQVLEVETASVEQAAPEGWLTVLASVSLPRDDPSFAAGTKWLLDGSSGSGRVIKTGRPVRIDDYGELPGEIAERARRAGLTSSISIPILVDGNVWGVVGVGQTARQRLALDTEVRLHDFTSLVATAISNAQARERIRRIADEQAALRRVATHVAEGAPPEQLFSTVAEEVAGILGVPSVRIIREAPGSASVVVASIGEPADEGASVAAPILVEDRLWGTIIVGGWDEQVPIDAAARLAAFTELVAAAITKTQANEELRLVATEQAALGRIATLVARAAPLTEISAAVVKEQVRHPELGDDAFAALIATAVANAQARDDLRAFVEEQDALRRVATLVAAGASSDELFAGVVGEVSRVMGVSAALLERDEPEGSVHTLARVPESDWEPVDEVVAPIVVDGRRWGAIRIDVRDSVLPENAEARLGAFTDLVATAVSNAAARSELLASRARIVAAGDDARRRIERDLHDGTQQRLLALGLDLQRIRATLPAEQADVLEGFAENLGAVLDDVRELSRGLHPSMLSRRGLLTSLRTLARRAPVLVQLDVALPERPPLAIETALYHAVAEALANAARHGRASQLSVTITATDGDAKEAGVDAVIADDGVGGANFVGGAGLAGLADRIDALGGRIDLESPPGSGTRISIALPVGRADA